MAALSKAELEAWDNLKDGYELCFDWIAHKWSLRKLQDNGMLCFIRLNPSTAKNIIAKLDLVKLPYNRSQEDMYGLRVPPCEPCN